MHVPNDANKFKIAVSARRQIQRGESVHSKVEYQSKLAAITERTKSVVPPSRTFNQGIGELILENKLAISKAEGDYFSNPKVFSNTTHLPGGKCSEFYSHKPKVNAKHMEKSGAEFNRYNPNYPSYLRYMDNPNYRNIKHTNAVGEPIDMIHIVSRNQGWITVYPETNDRKHPLEKKRQSDVTEVNVLSPIWMQVRHQKPKEQPMKAMSINADPRTKGDRTILVDKQQPNRSIYKLLDHSKSHQTKHAMQEAI